MKFIKKLLGITRLEEEVKELNLEVYGSTNPHAKK